jgi:hypothetical protein
MKGIPDKFKKEIETLIWDFIRERKVNQIKRDVCCLDIENGGMSMVNLDSYIDCTHCNNFVHAWIDFLYNKGYLFKLKGETFEHLQRKKVSLNFKSSLLNQYFPIAVDNDKNLEGHY